MERFEQAVNGLIREREKKQPKTDIIEFFSSFQGEGIFLGTKQIFVRFAGCNLNCSFCDTPSDAKIKNVSCEELAEKIRGLEKYSGPHHSISLTGGEPLLHADFLMNILPRLKEEKFKIYLETNGTLFEGLKRVINHVDIVAMDIKLPSSTAMPVLWRNHIEFLKVARDSDFFGRGMMKRRRKDTDNKTIFVKVVITENTSQEDIIRARDIVEIFDKDTPFILQPASIDEKGNCRVAKEKLSDFLTLSKERLNDVRIIPQMHKLVGIK